MNKLLLRLSTVILGLGMLGAAACSGCSQTSTDTASNPAFQQQSMNCGAYTHRVGNQCVADTQSSATGSRSTRPATLPARS